MKRATLNSLSDMQANFKKWFLLIVITLLAMSYGFAQSTITSTATGGPWDVGTTWVGGVVPTQGNNNNVTIAATATVTVPANASCVNLTVNGNLNFTGTGITLQVGNPGSSTGSMTLGPGSNLFIGASNTLEFRATQTGPGITNNGGTIASSGTNGSDGGTILLNSSSGGGFFIGGSAATTVYNLRFIQNATFNISGPSLRINGTFTIPNNNWGWDGASISPIYGPASTLYIDRGNQGYSQGKEWSVNAGTIGTTPGYPANVTLVNMGSSVHNGTGWRPTGAVGLYGTLQIGTGASNGRITLEDATSVNCGGIIVENNSLIIGTDPGVPFNINRGNFTLAGGTVGVFQNMGGTINFNGTGTVGSPQLISTTGSAITLSGIQVSNGTYVRLEDPVSLTTSLTMTSGYIGTTNTNLLTVNNSVTTAITGGGASAYVDGPLAWSIPATTSGNYVFPVGDRQHGGGAYLPLTLSPNTTSGAVTTVTAFNQNSGGSHDATINTMSTTEYWSVSTSSPFSSGPLVSVTRPTSVSPYNALGLSSTASGVYTAIGGTPGGNTISGGGIGTASPAFVLMVNAPLSVMKLGGTNTTCNGTVGSLIVGGSGGTAPYTYSINGGPFQVSGTFSPLAHGDHTVTVRDNTGATANRVMKVLGSIVINGNGNDIDICPGESTSLNAVNQLNNNPTYSWSTSPGGTPVIGTTPGINVSPMSATTYYVTSNLYVTNLVTNGSFESGNTGFTSGYTLYAGAQYETTPGNGGLYTITSAGITQCQYFSMNGGANQPSLTAQSGSLYFVGDGYTGSSMVWSQTINGLTTGRIYKFQFYYAAGNPNATRAVLRPTINGGGSLGDVTTTNSNGWTLATYNWTATGGSATLAITNMTSTGNTGGNDFFLDNIEFLEPCTVTESIDVTLTCSLPVELLYFNAEKQGAGALLTWSTVTEINSAYFVVEKSSDGKSFSPIGQVKAAGNSHAILKYSFIDPLLETGITYYRLAQYDIDGTVHYSEIRALTKNGVGGVQVIPNPNNGVFTVLLDNANETSYRVYVLNSLGQEVYAGVESTSNFQNIDISSLAVGVYYLRVSTDEETIIQKIVKQ